MNRAPGRVSAALLSAAALALAAAPAGAQPQPPATFFGSASIDGKPVPAGTEVRAFIDGIDCTQPGGRGAIEDGAATVYVVSVVHESQTAGCGTAGKTIRFRIGGRDAGQTGTWQTGLQHVDLNSGSGQPVALPSPSPGTAASADAAATATEGAKFTPKPGAPPTDEAGLSVIKPGPGLEPEHPAGGKGGVSPALVLGLGVLVLGGAAAAGGVAMSRRGRNRDDGPGGGA